MNYLRVNLPELRAQMGRADINKTQLSALSGVPYVTLHRLFGGHVVEWTTLSKTVAGLNKALVAAGFPTVSVKDMILEEEEEEESSAPALKLELSYQ